MKKVLLLTCCTISFFAATAQTQSGGMMIGASLGYYSTNYKQTDSKSSSSSLSPSFGYFVADNFCIGLSVISGRTVNTSPLVTSRGSDFGFGPFARYYKFTSNEAFAFFVDGKIMAGFSKASQTGNPDSKSRSISFQVSPGFSYFFTKHWAAELAFQGLVISSHNTDASGGAEYTQVGFGIQSFSPSLGMRYYFGNN